MVTSVTVQIYAGAGMGGFYGSTQVRTDDRDRVVRVAGSVARAKSVKCLVGPAVNGWVGLYPENGGQDESFGEAVALEFGGEVLHLVVHDDSVFAYWLWRERALADSFRDPPDYFAEADRATQEWMSGNAEVLKPFLAGGKRLQDLADLLRRDGRRETFQVERLQRFAKILGIANAATSYEYLKEDDHAGVRGWKQFGEVPADEIEREKNAGRERRRQINALKKRLRQSGVLIAEVAKDRTMPRCAAAAGDGFLLTWQGPSGAAASFEHYRPPWRAPDPIEVPGRGQLNVLVSDIAGRRVAAGYGQQVVVYDAATWRTLAELPERDWTIGLEISPDGALLARASRREVVITRLDDSPNEGGRGNAFRVAAVTGSDRRSLALHPSGRWLVGASQLAVGLLDLAPPEPRWRDLFVGGKSRLAAGVTELIGSRFAEMDLEAIRRQWSESTEGAVNQMRQHFKHLPPAEAEQKVAELRASMAEQARSWGEMFERARAGAWDQPAQGEERPSHVGISADGRLLWCGTARGLRVYDWEAVVAASGDAMPPPRFAYADPSLSGNDNYIYAAAEEPAGDAIAFAGLAGKVYRMDLSTGEVRELLAMPEQESIYDLKLSADGAALALCTQPAIERRRGRHAMRYVWSVWSYPVLVAGAA